MMMKRRSLQSPLLLVKKEKKRAVGCIILTTIVTLCILVNVYSWKFLQEFSTSISSSDPNEEASHGDADANYDKNELVVSTTDSYGSSEDFEEETQENCDFALVVAANLEGTQPLMANIYSVIQNYKNDNDDEQQFCIFVFSAKEDLKGHRQSIDCFLSGTTLPKNVSVHVKAIDKSTWTADIFVDNAKRGDLNFDYNWVRYYVRSVDVGNARRMVYMDYDTVCLGNINELFHLDLQDYAAAAANHPEPFRHHLCTRKVCRDALSDVKIWGGQSPYEVDTLLNAGMLVLDLNETVRQRWIQEWERLVQVQRGLVDTNPFFWFFDRHPKLWLLGDQPGFTLAVRDYVRLPDEWNFGNLRHRISLIKKPKERQDEICRAQKLIHFNGAYKPWKGKPTDERHLFSARPCQEAWFEYDVVGQNAGNHSCFVESEWLP